MDKTPRGLLYPCTPDLMVSWLFDQAVEEVSREEVQGGFQVFLD